MKITLGAARLWKTYSITFNTSNYDLGDSISQNLYFPFCTLKLWDRCSTAHSPAGSTRYGHCPHQSTPVHHLTPSPSPDLCPHICLTATERKGRKEFLSKFIHQETLCSAFPSAKNQGWGGDELAPTALAQQPAAPCRAPPGMSPQLSVQRRQKGIIILQGSLQPQRSITNAELKILSALCKGNEITLPSVLLSNY